MDAFNYVLRSNERDLLFTDLLKHNFTMEEATLISFALLKKQTFRTFIKRLSTSVVSELILKYATEYAQGYIRILNILETRDNSQDHPIIVGTNLNYEALKNSGVI